MANNGRNGRSDIGITEPVAHRAAERNGHERKKKRCYFINPAVRNTKGEFIPCIAQEGTPGFFTTDWAWGKDIDEAEKLAIKKNKRLGISDKECWKLQLRSMRK